MINDKIGKYFNGIHNIMSEQIDLLYEYNNHKDVEGFADDFPFFNLFVHLKKNFYETLLQDLYSQGKDLSAYLTELNNLPEFKEMGVEIKATSKGLVFPHIVKFAASKKNKKYTFYNFELFFYNRYILGLEYILFKFAPLMIEGIYADFETMDGEWTSNVYEHRNSWIGLYWADKFGHFRAELQKEFGPLSVLVDDNEEVIYKTRGEDLETTCPNKEFASLGYYDSLVFTDEDMIDEYGEQYESVDDIPWNIKWKRFVEQVDYYYYCCYRRIPSYEVMEDVNINDEVQNIWEVNTSKTFGVCLVKDMGMETEDVIDLIVPVPFLGESLVRSFHNVKACSFSLGYKSSYKEGCTHSVHITSEYRKVIKEKLQELLDKGYVPVVNNPDYHSKTDDGVDYYPLETIDQDRNLWTSDCSPDWYDGGKPEFFDKNEYVKQILFAQWTDEYVVENEDIREALKNGLPFEFEGKKQLLKTYDTFIICVLRNLKEEMSKGTFNGVELIEDILRKTYLGMHKLYVSQAIAVGTSRNHCPITKSQLQVKLGVGSAATWNSLINYYDSKTPACVFKAAQIEEVSRLIEYEILERIED